MANPKGTISAASRSKIITAISQVAREYLRRGVLRRGRTTGAARPCGLRGWSCWPRRKDDRAEFIDLADLSALAIETGQAEAAPGHVRTPSSACRL
jgi:hypothetical protein